jgi:hypothetical protein
VRQATLRRLTAGILAFLVSLSAPGSAFAHGTAHQREHHHQHGAATDSQIEVGSHAHHDGGDLPHGAPLLAGADGDGAIGAANASESAPAGSHDHPTVDASIRPRVAMADAAPVPAPPVVLAINRIADESSPPLPHAALARPDPDATSPPRTRAPPLR